LWSRFSQRNRGAAPVRRRRVIANFNAEAEGITVEQIIEKILALIPRGKRERLL
jgi:hypothetical protein